MRSANEALTLEARDQENVTCSAIGTEEGKIIKLSTWTKGVLLLVSSMTVMAAAIIAPSLPGMSQHFDGQSDLLIKLTLTTPALLIAIAGAPVGRLADHIGRKHLLLAALLLYGIAGFSGYLADSLTMLLLGRAALGVSVAGIMSMSTTLIGDYFHAEERVRLLGMQASFMAFGGLVFLNVGGALAEWNWRGPFFMYLFAIALLPLAQRILYEPPRASTTPDEIKGTERLNRSQVAIVYSAALLGMMLIYVVPTQLPFLLTEAIGTGSLAVGFAISITSITSAVTSFFYPHLRVRLSLTSIYGLAFLLTCAGYLIIGVSRSYLGVTAGVALSGIGLGLFMPNGPVWLLNLTPQRLRGRIIGGYTSMLFLGQFVSPLAVSPLETLLRETHSSPLSLAFIAIAALSFLISIVFFLLPPEPGRTRRGFNLPRIFPSKN